MGYKFEFDGHTIEISYSGSGSIDPWSGEYAREIGVSQWGTSDIGTFALVDGDRVYRLWGASSMGMYNSLTKENFNTWEDVEEWLKKNVERDDGSLADMKKSLDERKKKEDAYNALTPKEKEKYLKEWRRKRDEELEKMKEQIKGQ